jgi:hypothetical protein
MRDFDKRQPQDIGQEGKGDLPSDKPSGLRGAREVGKPLQGIDNPVDAVRGLVRPPRPDDPLETHYERTVFLNAVDRAKAAGLFDPVDPETGIPEPVERNVFELPRDGRPNSERVPLHLFEAMARGVFTDSLPSEADLADAVGRSRPTIREALVRLEEGGMIDRHRGVSSTINREHLPNLSVPEETDSQSTE